MARGRMVAKTLSTSERFAALYDVAGELAEFCQVLYPLMVAHSDDFGRQQGDAFTVKHLVLPISPRPIQEFESALHALHKVGLIVWYESDGRKVIQIQNFGEHQPGLHKKTRSKFPEPPGNSGNFPEIPSELKGTELKGTEGKGRESAPTPADLLALWNATVMHLPKAQALSPDRERHARARLDDCADLLKWGDVFSRMDASDFCQGKGRTGWRADFDFAIKPGTFAKVLEGKYDNRSVDDDAVTPAEYAAAEKFRQSAWGRCPHEPKCHEYPHCINVIALEARRTKQGAA